MKYVLSYDKSKIDNNFVDAMSTKFCMEKPIIELLCGRGIDSEEKLENYLFPKYTQLNDPFLFRDMKAVVEKISQHIKNENLILIYGDYDVDGISATSTLVKYLTSIGGKVVSFLPNRYYDGYGMSINLLEKLIEKYNFKALISVDCGITAIEEVEYLKEKNIDVIITDHHEASVDGKLPNCPIINAKCDSDYPFKELCGAGIALKIVQAIGGVEALKEYLPITAIATIADIVEMLDENRFIVAEGLKNLQYLPKGIKKLIYELGLRGNVQASDIAFKLAPKLNASGRMGDAERSLALYLENDDKEIEKIIKDILNYNVLRQELCANVYNDVKEILSKSDIYNTKAIICSSEKWDVGILGIVAAKVAEEFNRVTFLFSQQGDTLTGSCRSVNGVNVHELLCGCADILDKFGGHVMAAGVTLNVKNYDQFCTRTKEYVANNLKKDDLLPTKSYDLDIDERAVSLKLIEDMGRMEPCGHQNFRPIFKFTLKNATISPLKKFPEHLVLKYSNMSLLSFNSADKYFVLSGNTSCNILTELSIDNYKNQKKISGIVKSIDYEDIYRPKDNDIILAEYIKQITYENKQKYNFKNYDRVELVRFLVEMKEKIYGTLFIANDYNTYLNFKTIFDAQNIIRNRIFEVGDLTGLNTILLAPKNFANFNSFCNIVFLDPVLHTGYLSELSCHTNATIYLPYKSSFSYSVFHKIDLTRQEFGRYFRLLEFISETKMVGQDAYSLFTMATKTNKVGTNFNYLQFCVCVNVFIELGLLKISNKNYSYKTKNIKSDLSSSGFYNRLKVIQISRSQDEKN